MVFLVLLFVFILASSSINAFMFLYYFLYVVYMIGVDFVLFILFMLIFFVINCFISVLL